MVTIKDLTSIINDSMLDELFKKRYEVICSITKSDKKTLETLYAKRNEGYKRLLLSIDNIPNPFVETRKEIEKSIEEHIENINSIGDYFDEKLYKTGVVDRHKLNFRK